MKEPETQYKQGLIHAPAKFKLPNKTQINLPTLELKLKTTPWINSKLVHTRNQTGKPSYVQISLIIEAQKNSFKIYRNGTITVCHSISPQAITRFFDFFYHWVIINCLEDST